MSIKSNGDSTKPVTGGGGNITSTGLEAAPPGSPAIGDLYFPTNSRYVHRYNGTLWVPWGPINSWSEPVDGDFAWINQGAASVSTTNGGVALTAPAAAGDNLRIRKKAAPATPYTITAYFEPLLGVQTGAGASYGIGFRQSVDGKLHALVTHQSDLGEILSLKFTNPTTFSAIYVQSGLTNAVGGFGPLRTAYNVAAAFPIKWLRITDDGVNRLTYFSFDGIEWIQFSTIGRTDFLTADEVFFETNASNAGTGCKVHLLSWKES